MVNKINDWQDFLPNYARQNAINSNNYEIFNWIAEQYLEIYRYKEQMEQWRDVDAAKGAALDDIGRNYGEYRGEANDQFFRFMIKAKILASRSKATANDIINVIAQSLNLDKTGITLQNDRSLVDGKFVGTPYSISLHDLPLSFTANDFEKRYLIKTIENSSASGIKVSGISFLDTSSAGLGVAVSTSYSVTYTSESSVSSKTI